ncbi:microcystin-dependent protein [Mesorhizobium sp. Root102]|uniref:phage tail protein n=1 Tax=Mesorhizobium sp. Root102 TaxID=1736422 RepID=UPI0006F4A758|nr:tail fiber protein [Mesorhizobium sp. Root102]KQU78746.1 microcystin-dependent protein [Mesorhizobium sp. Root102]
MAEFFLGQIMLTGFGFAPKGFALSNGQILPIVQNQALFSLLGTTYGGDGQVTFALPNVQGSTPVGFGPSADPAWQPSPYNWGETGGIENVSLLSQQLPNHSHVGQGTTANGAQRNPANTLYGTNANAIYALANGAQVPLASPTVTTVGGNQPHANMQPYQVINYNIALVGIFPSRN